MAQLLALLVLAAGQQAATGPWSEPPGVPAKVGEGGGIVATDTDTLYVLCGDNNGKSSADTDLFFKYSISTGTWTELAKVPGSVGIGGAITFMPETNHVYVLRGNGTAEFYRYDIGNNAWTNPDELSPLMGDPDHVAGPGSSLAATPTTISGGGKVYAMRGGSTDFCAYHPDDDAWEALPALKYSVGKGSALAYASGTGLLYAIGSTVGGGGTGWLWSFSIKDQEWQPPLSSTPHTLWGGLAVQVTNDVDDPVVIYVGGAGGYPIIRYGAQSGLWSSWDILPMPSQWGVGVIPSGSGLALPQDSKTLYVLRGGTNHLWRVDTDAEALVTTLARAPANANVLVGVGDNTHLYSIGLDDGATTFYRYTITEGQKGLWEEDAPLPISRVSGQQARFTDRTRLLYDGTGYIYACGVQVYSGIAPWSFFRYAVNGGRWEELPETWATASSGGQEGSGITAANGTLYAAIQSSTSGFLYAFDGTWHKKASPPQKFLKNSAMAYPGSGDLIFAFRGLENDQDSSSTFWCYSISQDAWNVKENGSPFDPADCPTKIGTGASLCYSGRGAMIYGFSGNLPDEPASVGRFWGYSTTGDRWIEGTRAPAEIVKGAGLATPGAGKYLYALSGMTELWRYEKENFAPNSPTALGQFRLNGTPIDGRRITIDPQLIISARVDDDDSEGADRVWLEVEVEGTDSPFLQTLESSHVVSGTTLSISVALPALQFGHYRWKARAVDSRGGRSEWVDFGGDSEWDFWYRDNAAPAVTASATQHRSWNGLAIAPGERVLDEGGIRFQVSATDAGDDAVAIEVRLAPVGGSAADTTPQRGALTYGRTAALALLPAPGEYFWEYRVVDEFDAATAWSSFGASSNQEVDFALVPFGSQGLPSCVGASAPSGSTGSTSPLLALLAVAFLVHSTRRTS